MSDLVFAVATFHTLAAVLMIGAAVIGVVSVLQSRAQG
jgi:hypothetical protein